MKIKYASIFIAAIAVLTSFGVANAADKSVHLDVQTGFTSQSGNVKNYQGIFNVQGTLSKNLNSKLSSFVTLGEDRVVRSSGIIAVGNTLVGLPNAQYGQFEFNVGGKLSISPVTFVKASYGQRPSDLFASNAQARGIREVNITVGTRLF
jgi:hypothetical protein